MTRRVFCLKLNQEEEGLPAKPMPGEVGEKIFNNISKKAWSLWLAQQTMIINEYRLKLTDPEAREFLKKEMENFLFKGDSRKPPGYIPEEN
jgi:Fe-S cluster biosynthesis and repair protein YggX